MDFTLTGAQQQLQSSIRRYLEGRYPPERIGELADAGRSDLAAWPELTRQGWWDPDLGMVELAVLAEESGRALHPVPWWTTAGLAAPAYHAAGTVPPGPATLADGAGSCRAEPAGAGWRVTGQVAAVVDAAPAGELVVAAGTGSGAGLFAVPRESPGVIVTGDHPTGGIDPLRGTAGLVLAGAPARPLVEPPAAGPLLAEIRRRGAALLAAEGVGVAARALEIAVGHAQVRVQFGRPIGAFQAVSHRLAECYADLELARSLAYRAACVLAGPAGDPPEALACAVHASRRAAVTVCEAAIQVCGGIGVSWEFPLHRWYRRALWMDAYHAAGPDPLATLAGLVLDRHRDGAPCR